MRTCRPPASVRHGLRALLLGTTTMIVGACSSSGPRADIEPPSLEALVAMHDGRVSELDSFWARASVRVEGRDAEGSRFSEQGEGHLQRERPDRVAITVGKLGEVYIALGANDTSYWLIDVTNSDRRVMVSGQQSMATPAKAAALGLPVHPRDVPVLLGLEPIDPDTSEQPVIDPDGLVALRVPSRWGQAVLRFDPGTLELVASAVYDEEGELIASAELSRHVDVANEFGQGNLGRVPGKAEIRVPGFEGFVRLVLDDPRVRSINATVFNPDRLRRAYRVREQIDLDADPVSPADAASSVPAAEPAP